MSDVKRATIRERRQITLPADFCRELDLGIGDSLTLELREGSLVLTPSRKAALDALTAIQKAFQESGITEEELLEEGRRVRTELVREIYGEDYPA
jgi:bifunctional DNA-binding transcriptional regulator/antitoxin component of YhaV-PrlF toxin-antitoxin module